MGYARREYVTDPEHVIPTAQGGVKIGTIPEGACEGQMTFVKRGTGDTVFIGLRGKIPTPTNYDIVLEDVGTAPGPTFSEDGIAIGDIKAISTSGTAKLSTYIDFNVKG